MFRFLEAATTENPYQQWISIGLMVAMFALLYFFMIRPQKKQEKQQNEMRNSLQVGDEITTIGGIIGKVVSIKEETVMIETGKDKTRIRFLRSAIRCVDVPASSKNAYRINVGDNEAEEEVDTTDVQENVEATQETKKKKKEKKNKVKD